LAECAEGRLRAEDKLGPLSIFEVIDGDEEEEVSNVLDENVFDEELELTIKQGSSREVTMADDELTSKMGGEMV
jgi:hypothetical protein